MIEAATTYRHTPDMGEIGGLSDDYEKLCQDMLEAGVKWLSEHPNAKLEGHTYAGVYGIFSADSEDAKALEKVVLAVSGGGCSGAQHHAVMSRLFWIAKSGWPAYCAELRKDEAAERASAGKASQ